MASQKDCYLNLGQYDGCDCEGSLEDRSFEPCQSELQLCLGGWRISVHTRARFRVKSKMRSRARVRAKVDCENDFQN